MVKNLPAMQTWVRSLGWEDPLEEGMATHSSILAWLIPWTEEPGGLQSRGSQRGDTIKWLSTAQQPLWMFPAVICSSKHLSNLPGGFVGWWKFISLENAC